MCTLSELYSTFTGRHRYGETNPLLTQCHAHGLVAKLEGLLSMVKSIMRLALTSTPCSQPISPPVKANLLREISFADDRLFAASRLRLYSSSPQDQNLGIVVSICI